MKDFIIKLSLSLLCMFVASIPTLLFLWAKSAISPHGFWETIIFTTIGIYFLAGIQIVLVIALFAFLWMIWFEEWN